MARYTTSRSVQVAAPVKAVFDFLRNPANVWGSFPEISISDIHVTPAGVGTTDRFSLRHLGMVVERGTHEVVEVVPYRRMVVTSRRRAGSRSVWTWTLRPDGDGTTLILDVTTDSPRVVADRFVDRSATTAIAVWLSTIKQNVEALATATAGLDAR